MSQTTANRCLGLFHLSRPFAQLLSINRTYNTKISYKKHERKKKHIRRAQTTRLVLFGPVLVTAPHSNPPRPIKTPIEPI